MERCASKANSDARRVGIFLQDSPTHLAFDRGQILNDCFVEISVREEGHTPAKQIKT